MNEQDQSMKSKKLPWPKQPAGSGIAGLLRTACAMRWLLLLLLLTLPAVVQAQFIYTTETGTITIIGYTGLGGVVVIPDTFNGLAVTSIGDYAFYRRTNLTSVTIPSGVTTIGQSSFSGCIGLMSITIPDSVTSIGGAAFEGCTSLTSVTIPSSVTSVGGGAFGGCTSMTAITVDANNSTYGSVDGVLFNKSRTTLVECPGGKTGTYTIPQ